MTETFGADETSANHDPGLLVLDVVPEQVSFTRSPALCRGQRTSGEKIVAVTGIACLEWPYT